MFVKLNDVHILYGDSRSAKTHNLPFSIDKIGDSLVVSQSLNFEENIKKEDIIDQEQIVNIKLIRDGKELISSA